MPSYGRCPVCLRRQSLLNDLETPLTEADYAETIENLQRFVGKKGIATWEFEGEEPLSITTMIIEVTWLSHAFRITDYAGIKSRLPLLPVVESNFFVIPGDTYEITDNGFRITALGWPCTFTFEVIDDNAE